MATVTASMSTIAWREPGLAVAVRSLLPQVDRLNVFLQGYSHVPACLEDPRVTVLRDTDAPESAALGASAKYHWYWHGLVEDGYHLAVDDDIEYPPDYVQRCMSAIGDRRVVVGFHGGTYRTPMRRYFRDRQVYRFDKPLAADTFVHMLGTGTTAMHTSALRLTSEDFTAPNSCDLFIAIAGQRQQVPMLCLARNRGYLRALPLAYDERAASADEGYAARMVALHATVPEWKVYTT